MSARLFITGSGQSNLAAVALENQLFRNVAASWDHASEFHPVAASWAKGAMIKAPGLIVLGHFPIMGPFPMST